MAYHSQAGMLLLLPSRAFGQPPMTVGKVAGPRWCSSEDAELLRHYQFTNPSNGVTKQLAQAFCQNWCRSLKEAPLSLSPRSQYLAG